MTGGRLSLRARGRAGGHIPYVIPFLLAFLERTVFDLGPNYELLTAAMILSSYFINRKSTFLLTLLVIAFSDRIIGNSKIFLFTWTGFLLPALFASPILRYLYTKYSILHTKILPLTLTLTGVSANLFFFIYTNLGVWLLDSWGMYTKDLSGLILCYINGLPFLKNQIVSSLIFIPMGFVLINIALAFYRKFIFEKKYHLDPNNRLHHI